MNPDFNIDKKYLHWTLSAIECYERGCICEGCPVFEIVETQCVMKRTVLKLVKIWGKPPTRADIDVNDVIRKLEEGQLLKDIAAEYGITATLLQSITKPCGISAHNYKSKRKKKK